MILNVYAYKDHKGTFAPLFVELNDATAKRQFNYLVSDRSTMMGFAPADYDLMHLGTFDSVSGKVDPCIPTFVANGQEVLDG